MYIFTCRDGKRRSSLSNFSASISKLVILNTSVTFFAYIVKNIIILLYID